MTVALIPLLIPLISAVTVEAGEAVCPLSQRVVIVSCCSISPTIRTIYSLGGVIGISELPPLRFNYHVL